MPRRRDAVDVAVRVSTRRVREPRQFRNAVVRRRPEEAKKFDKINKEFKSIMKTTHESPVVVRAATQKEFDALTAMGDRLDKCQKSLTDYLDTKRNAFSRFYFISDDELLSVLGSSDPTSIQVHMLKLFDNVKELKFGR